MNARSLSYRQRMFQHWRIYVLVLFIFLVSITIIFRLYLLQIVHGEDYRSRAQSQYYTLAELTPNRGEVFLEDRGATYPLAVNKILNLVYAVPKEISNPLEIAKALSPILEMDLDELIGKLDKPGDGYEILKHKVSDEKWNEIKSLNLVGIHASDEALRFYPAGELASSVIGFYGFSSDGSKMLGRYGIEAAWDEQLRGKEGIVNQEKDAGGRWIPIGKRSVERATDGDDLILTIDSNVQYEVERMVRRAMIKHETDKALAIVMDVKTGKILALASQPTFDPNKYSEVELEDFGVFKNQAVNDTYECGSVFKTITMATGLDAGKVTPDSTFIDTGRVVEAGYTIMNSDEKSYGESTMTFVLEESLNTGAIYVEKQVGNKLFYDYIKNFGFGEKTQVGLLGEVNGNVSNLEDTRRDINFFTASFGQGITVTPIQLTSAYSALANGGILYKPYIVQSIIRPNGEEIEVQPKEIRRVISTEASKEISEMLESVVLNGHGKRAIVPGYRVGGKTGTAQVASSTAKGYEEGITIGSFAGYGPIEEPRFAVLVKMDNPKDVQWAESSAGPLFGEIMNFLLSYYGVEPTKTITEEDIALYNSYHQPYWDIKLEEIDEEKENEDKAENEETKENESNNSN